MMKGKNTQFDIEGIITRLKGSLSVQRDNELAEKIGTHPRSISQWRMKNTISMDLLVGVCLQCELSIDYIVNGKRVPGQDSNIFSQIFKTLYGEKYENIFHALSVDKKVKLITTLYEQSGNEISEKLVDDLIRLVS
ncbi:MAG TPA: hypothetical protein DCM31_07425 [Deferribacteraceae bacterium]|nr:hypothetical protein [Deferribacteraceae bacterium]